MLPMTGVSVQQCRVLCVLHTYSESEREHFGIVNCKKSGASSQSRASFHSQIRDFKQHVFSLHIDLWGVEYGTKNAYF